MANDHGWTAAVSVNFTKTSKPINKFLSFKFNIFLWFNFSGLNRNTDMEREEFFESNKVSNSNLQSKPLHSEKETSKTKIGDKNYKENNLR